MFGLGDALNLPLPENRFAAAGVAFGIRNTGSLERALAEMQRILRPGGKALILEFTQPRGFFFGPLYLFYFKHILPLLGRLIAAASGDAYRYLPQSVQAFAGPEEMRDKMAAAGFVSLHAEPLCFGVAHLYVGHKKTGREPG